MESDTPERREPECIYCGRKLAERTSYQAVPAWCCPASSGQCVMSDLYSVRPATRLAGDDEPGVSLQRLGEPLSRLSPDEARSLGADLILAASTSEAQWDSGGADLLEGRTDGQ